MKVEKSYVIHRPKEIRHKCGIIEIRSDSFAALIPSTHCEPVLRKTRSEIYKGTYGRFNEFCQEVSLGKDVTTKIISRHKTEELMLGRLYETKLDYIEKGVYLLNPDIIQVRDTIVPFRYQKYFKELVRKLENYEISEDFLKSIIKIKL